MMNGIRELIWLKTSGIIKAVSFQLAELSSLNYHVAGAGLSPSLAAEFELGDSDSELG